MTTPLDPMVHLSYLNFDLAVQPTAEGYRIGVLDSPVGQVSAPFVLPFSDLEIENAILRLGRVSRATRRVESEQMETARAFGRDLFRAVFPEDVRVCLAQSLLESERQGRGLRIRLRLSEAAELVDLPWELLYDEAADRFLSLSVTTPLIRYLDLPGRVEPLAVVPPLRVLAVIASPVDYPALQVEAEWDRVQQALGPLIRRGLLELHRLESPTLESLQQALRRTELHILHFIGHGAFDSRSGSGALIFEDDRRRGRVVGGRDLGALLYDEKSMRLAVLNACEGGRASRSDPFAGVAQSLVRQGVPAVVAMQFEISDQAATELATSFYAALVDGYPVDAALTEARKSLFAGTDGTEWATPVLYLRSSDGRIFDLQLGAQGVSESAIGSPAADPRPQPPADRRTGATAWLPWALLLVLLVTAGLLWTATQWPLSGAPAAGSASAPPAEPILFDFAPGRQPWKGDSADSWQVVAVETGGYALQGSAPADRSISSDPLDVSPYVAWQDYELAVQVRILQAGNPADQLPDVWITLRHDPDRATGCRGYLFALNIPTQQVQLAPVTHVGCLWDSLADVHAALPMGPWLDLRVRAAGSRLQLWLDGQPIIDTTDDRATTGFFYVSVSPGTVAQFRSVRATRLDRSP